MIASMRLAAFLTMFAWASIASAQGTPADALFERGVSDMEAGKYESGCPAIAESLRLDPRPGTLFTLAECKGKWGKATAAIEHYKDYLARVAAMPPPQKVNHAERAKIATETLKKLDASVARVTFSLPPQAPSGVELALDGAPLATGSLGSPTALDPGEHTLVSKTGSGERTQKFSLKPGETTTLQIELPAAASAQPAPSSSSTSASVTPSSISRNTWLYVAGGAAVVGFAAGAIGGIVAFSKKSEADKNCAGLACSPEGFRAIESGRSAALVSTIGFGVGLVGAGAAAALWVTRPKESAWQILPLVSPQNAGLGLRGGW